MQQLTAKQQKFIDGICSGLTQAEAYRQAYNAKNMNVLRIAKKASELATRGDIKGIIDERKKKLANAAIWDREKALIALKELFADAKAFSVKQAVDMFGNRLEDKETGEPLLVFDSKAAGAAIKAIEQANKMCGYNEPEKIEQNGELAINITVID